MWPLLVIQMWMLLKTTGGGGENRDIGLIPSSVEQPSSGKTNMDDNKINNSDTNNTKLKHINKNKTK